MVLDFVTLAANRKCSFAPVDLLLWLRGAAFLCAGDMEQQLIKRNHKQTNRQRLSVISEHFNTVFLFLTSLSD